MAHAQKEITNQGQGVFDLTIVTNDMSYLELNKIKNELDELNLPYLFDLSIFSEIDNQDLIKHIERVGIPF